MKGKGLDRLGFGLCHHPWPEEAEGRAAEEALDKIAALCGCPSWDYPGQVVRDVEQAIGRSGNRPSPPAVVHVCVNIKGHASESGKAAPSRWSTGPSPARLPKVGTAPSRVLATAAASSEPIGRRGHHEAIEQAMPNPRMPARGEPRRPLHVSMRKSALPWPALAGVGAATPQQLRAWATRGGRRTQPGRALGRGAGRGRARRDI